MVWFKKVHSHYCRYQADIFWSLFWKKKELKQCCWVLRHDRPSNGSIPQRALFAAAVSDPSVLTLSWPVLWKAGVCGGWPSAHSLEYAVWHILDSGVLWINTTPLCSCLDIYVMTAWWLVGSIIVLCVGDYGRELNDISSFWECHVLSYAQRMYPLTCFGFKRFWRWWISTVVY